MVIENEMLVQIFSKVKEIKKADEKRIAGKNLGAFFEFLTVLGLTHFDYRSGRGEAFAVQDIRLSLNPYQQMLRPYVLSP